MVELAMTDEITYEVDEILGADDSKDEVMHGENNGL